MSLLFLSVAFFFIKVKADGGCRDLDFLACEQNKTFVGHVIKTFRILCPGLDICQHECFMDDRCVSYNLGPEEGTSRICNLSNTDHLGYPDDVKPAPGAEYCPIKNPCSKKPCPSHLFCKPDFEYNSFKCVSSTSCAELKITGKNENGVYNITPVPGLNVQVYCDQQTDGGGWTVIQKRFNGSVDFYRGWDDYKRGFGDKNGEYWLGLDAIHILTNSRQNELRVELEDFAGVKYHAVYNTFKVGPESQNYMLILGTFKEGNAGDSLTFHNGLEFTTRDRDNDQHTSNCASRNKSAWWFKKCHFSHLNGLYYATSSVPYGQGLNWRTVTGLYSSVRKAQMKIRAVGFRG